VGSIPTRFRHPLLTGGRLPALLYDVTESHSVSLLLVWLGNIAIGLPASLLPALQAPLAKRAVNRVLD